MSRKPTKAQIDVINGLARRRWHVFQNYLRGRFEYHVEPWVNDRYPLDARTIGSLERRGLLMRMSPKCGREGRRTFKIEQELVLTDAGRPEVVAP